jgi:hypothetical protein
MARMVAHFPFVGSVMRVRFLSAALLTRMGIPARLALQLQGVAPM